MDQTLRTNIAFGAKKLVAGPASERSAATLIAALDDPAVSDAGIEELAGDLITHNKEETDESKTGGR